MGGMRDVDIMLIYKFVRKKISLNETKTRKRK